MWIPSFSASNDVGGKALDDETRSKINNKYNEISRYQAEIDKLQNDIKQLEDDLEKYKKACEAISIVTDELNNANSNILSLSKSINNVYCNTDSSNKLQSSINNINIVGTTGNISGIQFAIKDKKDKIEKSIKEKEDEIKKLNTLIERCRSDIAYWLQYGSMGVQG